MWNWIKEDLHQDSEGLYWILDHIIIKDWDTRVYFYIQVKRCCYLFYHKTHVMAQADTLLERNVK